jgi:DNA-directed RNA polymerase specialized sigma24 family protein
MPPALQTTTRDSLFASTRWSVVRHAADSQTSSEHALSALSELCQIYWRPVYLFLRRDGYAFQDAEDLTQGFFAHLIENRAYTRADPQKGRFRAFLLGALKYFIADVRKRERAQKRGGGAALLPLDDAVIAEAEARAVELERWSADRVYEREWAAALLREALNRLAAECALGGKKDLFESLKSHLSPGSDARVPYEQLASRLGRPAATLRSDVARLRERFGAILREEVQSTLLDAANVDGELRYLCEVMTA